MIIWLDQDEKQFQVQQKFACAGSFGCSDQRMHFGLGDATKIDSVVVNWPNGKTSEFFDINIDRFVTLHEGEDTKTHEGIIMMVGFVMLLSYILHRKG